MSACPPGSSAAERIRGASEVSVRRFELVRDGSHACHDREERSYVFASPTLARPKEIQAGIASKEARWRAERLRLPAESRCHAREHFEAPAGHRDGIARAWARISMGSGRTGPETIVPVRSS